MTTPEDDRNRLPPGRQPYDGLVGMRVGGVIGGIVGVVVVAVVGASSFWWVLVAAVVGGAVGYVSERRKMTKPEDSP